MILITGATGHTGGHVVKMLRANYPELPIRCLVRTCSKAAPLLPFGVEIVEGDLRADDSIKNALAGVHAVAHIASIRFSPKIAELAAAAGVAHVVMVHTTGMYSRYRAYSAEYRVLEETAIGLLKDTATRFTVVRPTMIYGGWKDYNFHRLINVLRCVPLFPLFGDGAGKMQPVHAEDLAFVIARSVANPAVYDKELNVSGGSAHTYKDVLRMVCRLLGKRVLLLPVPMWIALAAVRILNVLGANMLSVEQVLRLTEDKTFDHIDATRLLGYAPRRLEDGLRQQIREMGMCDAN